MQSEIELDILELKEFLLSIAPDRPVFIWGPPGIGKSSMVQTFSNEVGFECVSIIGSQLAPEDLIGIPKIIGNVSKFVPPSLIVREKPFCLFIDELNIASSEIQKAFYSLILDKKIGEYNLPTGSIVIGAGNRAADSSLVKQLPAALINRMIHVHLKVNSRLWLDWASNNNIHPMVLEYIKYRPKHLSTQIAPTDETPFSTPRSWEYVSDGLHSFGDSYNSKLFDALVFGCLSKEHAISFKAFIKQINYKYSVTKIVKGEEDWPNKPEDRDVLLFLVSSLREYLIRELPKNQDNISGEKKKLVIQVKDCLKKLTLIDNEYAQHVLVGDDNERLPNWFLIEITKELPKLTLYHEK